MKMCKVWMRYFKIVQLTMLFFSLTFSFCSSDNDPEFDPQFSIEENKIECKFCYEFGWIVEAIGNEVLVVDYDDIYIFEDHNGDFTLKQEIKHESTSGINTLRIHDNQLFLGIAESDGTGKVLIYEQSNNRWENVQQLRIGRYQDNFGSAIDIYGEYMVIGASAIWDGFDDGIVQNTDEGRIYIYKNIGSEWSLEIEFKAQNTGADDYFGESVAIYEDYIFAGSRATPLHVYHKNNEWELIKVDTISPLKIVHENNHFIVRNSFHVPPDVLEFELSSGGSYTLRDARIDFSPLFNVSSYGEMLEFDGSLLLTWIEYSEEASILNYNNDHWVELKRFSPMDGTTVVFSGLEIVNSHVFLAGRDSDSEYSYLYKFPI